jgi:hypothetical protein
VNENQKLEREAGINNRFLTNKLRRAANRERSAGMLQGLGIQFEVKNDGAHLIVRHEGQTVDFWPGTGKFIPRAPRSRHGRGVFNMLKLLGIDPKQPKEQP